MTEETTRRTAEIVERYVQFWNAAPAEQLRAGDEIFSSDITYVAPVGVLTGVEALADFTAQFSSHVGAYEFRARTEPDILHGRARLQWELRVGDASFAEGTDVLMTDRDGRIQSITAFLDRAPAGANPGEQS
ncbi:MAG TPA: nuclear transport factor 2 family protein [Nitrolancea sp.]|nr:nuclear transport factor 2 family protein [Nitrolancea sp.]